MAGRVTVTPDPFTLIPFDAAEIAALVEDVAALVEFPPDVEIAVEVDEELFPPLTGHMSDVVDGRAVLWISAGEPRGHPPAPRTSRPSRPAPTSRVMLLRAKDRLSDDFADAPPDRELPRGERVAWDIYAIGRASGSASRSGASVSSTTSGSSTASPTSPTPRSSGAGTRRR